MLPILGVATPPNSTAEERSMAKLAYRTPPPVPARGSGWRSALSVLARVTQVLVRMAVGLLFLQHGLQKIFGLLGGFRGQPGATVPLGSLMGVSGVLELVGGLLLVLGFLTRPVALVLAGEMLTAFFLVHFPRGGWPLQNGGELPLLYAAIFLFFAGNGAGPASVDAALRTTKTVAPTARVPPPLRPPAGELRRSGW
jgi:putative oxidoreductase